MGTEKWENLSSHFPLLYCDALFLFCLSITNVLLEYILWLMGKMFKVNKLRWR